MTSSEDFNRNIWFVLQKIKTNCIQNHLNIPLQYFVNLLDSKTELEILQELSEIGAIRIIQRRLLDKLLVAVTITIQPAFLQTLDMSSDTTTIENNTNNVLQKTKKKKNEISDKQQRLPINVVVSGLNERLDALIAKSPQSTGQKFPYKLPSGTRWEDIDITFLDDERIIICVKGIKYVTNYLEMGMVGKGKITKPCEQWNFLKVLAKCHGELSIKDPEAKDVYKKQKSDLSKTLRHYFSIDYDPFHPYYSTQEKIGNSYKIKIKLIPPPERPTYKDDLQDADTDQFGIHEYLETEAPQVVDY